MKKFLSVCLSIIAICSLLTGCMAKNIDVRQAYALIQSYSVEELGLTEEEVQGARYLRSNNTVNIDGVDYYEITISNIVKTGETDENGNEFYNFDDLGAYYVTLNGKAAYSKNLESGELTELPKKEVPELTEGQKKEIEREKESQKAEENK